MFDRPPADLRSIATIAAKVPGGTGGLSASVELQEAHLTRQTRGDWADQERATAPAHNSIASLTTFSLQVNHIDLGEPDCYEQTKAISSKPWLAIPRSMAWDRRVPRAGEVRSGNPR